MPKFVPIPPRVDDKAFREFSQYLTDLRHSCKHANRQRADEITAKKSHVVYAGRFAGAETYNTVKTRPDFVQALDDRFSELSTHDALSIEKKLFNVAVHPEGGKPPRGGQMWHTNVEDTRYQTFYGWDLRNRLVTFSYYVHHDEYGKGSRTH